MGDLDIRFSNENDNKKLNNSLDLKLNNGQFQKVEQEKPAPDVNEILKEEYYENKRSEWIFRSAKWGQSSWRGVPE